MPPFREIVPWHGDRRRLSYVNTTTTQQRGDSVGPAVEDARRDNRVATIVDQEPCLRPCSEVLRLDPDGGGCNRVRLNRRVDLE